MTGSLIGTSAQLHGFSNEMRCKTYTALFQTFFVIRDIIRRGRPHQHKDQPRRADGKIPTVNNYFETTAEIGMLQELNLVLIYLHESKLMATTLLNTVWCTSPTPSRRAISSHSTGHCDLRLRLSSETPLSLPRLLEIHCPQVLLPVTEG